MAGVNTVIILGNLGQDPETRYTGKGEAVTHISVATSIVWKDRTSGETKEQTEWHRIVCYRRLAEIARDYLAKGRKVYVEGRLQTRKWQTQDGQDRWTTEIVAEKLSLIDKAHNREAPRQTEHQSTNQPQDFDEEIPEIPF